MDQSRTEEGWPVATEEIEQWRRLFPITAGAVYLYNGGISPCCGPVRDALVGALETWQNGGIELWTRGQYIYDELRQRLGLLLNVSPDDVAILDNTTSAINMAIDIIRIGTDDDVVVTDLEFMANTYAFLGRLAPPRLRVARSHDGQVSIDELEAQITPATKAIHLSHITVGSGYRHALGEVANLARTRNVPLIVDIAQSLGVVPVDLGSTNVEFAVGTASKWMLGGPGIGFLYVRKDFQDRCPPAPGWFGAANAGEWDLFSPRFEVGAKRFQGGLPNILGLYAANAGASVIQDVGLERISTRVLDLTGYLIDRLLDSGVDVWTPRDRTKRGGIVFIRGIDHQAFMRGAQANSITVGNFLGGIRVDPHFYNTEEELELVVELATKHRRRPESEGE